ncbi:DinB family protein [Pseudomonas sp. KNUC1026]|uniref:DinB family protein n=1 Tax=Pseudomonas sp. KNUC1026 TaxID=2893890 RepID=UPI001F29CEE0|nr:DinB family protein [Pseudomonas sp. KNUC1026]UFH47979.1 DinB family protein [Pseudomonas sp. KNUC1026]
MLKDAYRYKVWADERTLAALADFERKYPTSPAFEFMRQQLNHMVIVEELFKARLLGEVAPHPATNTEVVPDLQVLVQRLAANNAWATDYLARLAPVELCSTVSFVFADGQHGAMTRQEILFHLINHGTYHRGAIGHALDMGGGKRPADTYSVFIHSAEPQRRQRAGG